MIAETTGNTVAVYLRGTNLICQKRGAALSYYLFNAHGDVTALTGTGGRVTERYEYDAFGNTTVTVASPFSAASTTSAEPNASIASLSKNPFRYCGEYWDDEAGTYYLRARYYSPALGRFTQQDPHWSPANRVYGDSPQRACEYEDRLGLNIYSYAPQLSAIRQSGNLYVYGMNNPVKYADYNGEIAFLVVTGLIGAAIGGIIGAVRSYSKYGEVRWQDVALGVGLGAAAGLVGGAGASLFLTGSATASVSMVAVGVQLKVAGITTVGYSSFELFKKANGNAGDGMAWHHIVQQTSSNIERFGAEMIHNAVNIVKIPHGAGTLHQMITNHYNSIQSFTGGLRVYQWLQLQSFNSQYAYGLKILTEFAEKLGITIQFVK